MSTKINPTSSNLLIDLDGVRQRDAPRRHQDSVHQIKSRKSSDVTAASPLAAPEACKDLLRAGMGGSPRRGSCFGGLQKGSLPVLGSLWLFFRRGAHMTVDLISGRLNRGESRRRDRALLMVLLLGADPLTFVPPSRSGPWFL